HLGRRAMLQVRAHLCRLPRTVLAVAAAARLAGSQRALHRGAGRGDALGGRAPAACAVPVETGTRARHGGTGGRSSAVAGAVGRPRIVAARGERAPLRTPTNCVRAAVGARVPGKAPVPCPVSGGTATAADAAHGWSGAGTPCLAGGGGAPLRHCWRVGADPG